MFFQAVELQQLRRKLLFFNQILINIGLFTILTLPYYSVKKPPPKTGSGFNCFNLETGLLDDLKVNSARLVDIVLAFEDAFDIEIADEDADSVNTVGDAVSLILSKQ